MAPLGSYWLLSPPLLLDRISSARLKSDHLLFAPLLLSAPLVSYPRLLALLIPSQILSSPLVSSLILLDPLLLTPILSALLISAPLFSDPLFSAPLLSNLLHSAPLWGEENIRSVGFSTLCTYIKKLTTSDTSLLLPRQMNLVVGNCLISNYVRIQFYLYGCHSTLKTIIVL